MRYADNSILSNPGSDLKQTYIPKVGKLGSVTLVPDGFVNVFDYIQSFRDSTDIASIVSRVAAGELDLLMKRPGTYGDFTKFPKTYAEMLQLQLDSTRLFNSLPADVKQKFGNDANRFLAESGTQDWFDKIERVLPDEVKSAVFPKVENNIDSEVKE